MVVIKEMQKLLSNDSQLGLQTILLHNCHIHQYITIIIGWKRAVKRLCCGCGGIGCFTTKLFNNVGLQKLV